MPTPASGVTKDDVNTIVRFDVNTIVRIAIHLKPQTSKTSVMGTDYVVFPAVLVREQVLNNNLGATYLPATELTGQWASTINASPVVIDHPSLRGTPVSARQPEILNKKGVGYVFNARVEGTEIKADVYLDLLRKGKVEGFEAVLAKLENGEPVELSTGFPVAVSEQEGVFNGKAYTQILHPVGFDHLAIFHDKVGACSVKDGCGLGINHDGPCSCQGGGMNQETQNATLLPPENVEVVKDPVWKKWIATAARVLGFSVPATNETDDDRRQLLQDALTAKFAGQTDNVFLVAVDSTTKEAVYERWSASDNQTMLFRSKYKIKDDNTVELGEPLQVRRVTTYEPVAANVDPAPADPVSTGGGDNMDRKKLIARLAANGPLSEVELEKLSDQHLLALAGVAEPDTALAEALSLAHGYRSQLDEANNRSATALQNEEKERIRLMEDVLYAKRPQDSYSDDEIRKMTVNELKKLHAIICPRRGNFALQGGPRDTVLGAGNFDFVRPVMVGNTGESVLDQKKEEV